MQTLLLESEPSGPYTVLRASGELDLSTQDEFEQVLGRLLGCSSVVVDLSRLEFLAISALRSLMVCHRAAGSAGREVFYAEPSRQVVRLLAVSGLGEVLPVRPSVHQLICSSLRQPVGGLPHQPLGDLAQLDVG